jgi:hypothetical protein
MSTSLPLPGTAQAHCDGKVSEALLGHTPSPPTRQATIDYKGMAVYETRVVTGEPEGSQRNISWFTGPAKRLDFAERFFEQTDRLIGLLRGKPKGNAEDRSRDSAWADAVDPDTAFAQFHRGQTSQMNDCGLCRAIRMRAIPRVETGYTCRIDDAAGPLPFHDRSSVFDSKENASKMDPKSMIECFDGRFLNRTGEPRNSGIVEDAIQAVKARQGTFNGGSDIGLLADVRVLIHCRASKLFSQAVTFPILDVRDEYTASFFYEEPHRGFANTTSPPRNDCYFSI